MKNYSITTLLKNMLPLSDLFKKSWQLAIGKSENNILRLQTSSSQLLAIFFIFTSNWLLTSFSFAQPTILYNNGAQFYTGPSSIVRVNGTFKNVNPGANSNVFEQDGTMTIATSTTSGMDGTVILDVLSTLKGNGTYNVEKDWYNSATFIADNSTVELYGDLQEYIGGSSVTTFNDLILSGTGINNNKKKTLLISAKIGSNGTLTINDRELETLLDTMYVLNPSPTCVTNVPDSGFVSGSFNTSGSGYLSRVTNTATAYFFPTGASAPQIRYRPVILTPASGNTNIYNVRLGNYNASLDNFNTNNYVDSNLCALNLAFYHQITRSSGTDNVDIEISYDPLADGNWDGMANWNLSIPLVWNSMGAVSPTSIPPSYSGVKKSSWTNFTNSPYILSRLSPSKPIISCPASVCANSPGNIFYVTGNDTSYAWISPAGTTITSGFDSDTVTIDWSTLPGLVSVSSISALGCMSIPDSCYVTLSGSQVQAQFSSETLENHYYNFTDLSTGGATEWVWDFGDGQTSNLQDPSHIYLACGSQKICLTASIDACADTSCTDMVVNELAIIPNVFSPDGDGINDIFYINNICLEGYKLEIYNRWGMKVFESNVGGWDGYTAAGKKADAGTYYYIFKGISIISSKDYSTKGSVTLVRNK